MAVLVQVFKQFSSMPQGHLQELFAPRFTEHELRDVTGKAAKKFFKGVGYSGSLIMERVASRSEKCRHDSLKAKSIAFQINRIPTPQPLCKTVLLLTIFLNQ